MKLIQKDPLKGLKEDTYRLILVLETNASSLEEALENFQNELFSCSESNPLEIGDVEILKNDTFENIEGHESAWKSWLK